MYIFFWASSDYHQQGDGLCTEFPETCVEIRGVDNRLPGKCFQKLGSNESKQCHRISVYFHMPMIDWIQILFNQIMIPPVWLYL